MPHFRTIVPQPSSAIQINHQNNILGIGSCFVQNIGQLLVNAKFPCLLNPFGIVYNPASIQQSIELLLRTYTFTKKDLVQNRGIWYSFAHHGAFSHPDASQALAQINQSLEQARRHLQSTNVLLVTLGTAAVFVHKATGQIVANCHKFPAAHFEKKQLSIAEIVEGLKQCFAQLKARNPPLSIILTVSPIRHIRDGLIENQRSKAKLVVAAAELEQTLNYVAYFPAYEMIMDDLRDYRFYEQDKIHPNQQAIEYIWEAFKKTYCTEASLQLLARINKIIQASQHRPFHPQTAAHQSFLKKQLQLIEQLNRQYPFLKFEKERAIFEGQMT